MGQKIMDTDDQKGKSLSTYIIIFLMLIILALTYVVMYRSNNSRLDISGNLELSLREQYPGHFRCPEEQAAFMDLPRNVDPVSSFTTVPGYNDTLQCNVNWGPFPLGPSFETTVYNACCKSNGIYISPVYLKDAFGENRKLAVFRNQRTGKETKQYFYTETCAHIEGCHYRCQCSQSIYYVTGVYVTNTGKNAVGWFPLDGCCKCKNY